MMDCIQVLSCGKGGFTESIGDSWWCTAKLCECHVFECPSVYSGSVLTLTDEVCLNECSSLVTSPQGTAADSPSSTDTIIVMWLSFWADNCTFPSGLCIQINKYEPSPTKELIFFCLITFQQQYSSTLAQRHFRFTFSGCEFCKEHKTVWKPWYFF